MNSIQIKEINDQLFHWNKELYSYWINEIFLTTGWWISLGLFVIPWLIVSIYIIKKKEFNKVISPILFCILFALFTDYLGVSYGIWYYTVKLTPLSIDIPWDFTLLPASVTFLLLTKPKMNPIYKALILAGLTSFIAEPLFNHLHYYVYLEWRYIYSFPIYFIVYIISYKLYKNNV